MRKIIAIGILLFMEEITVNSKVLYGLGGAVTLGLVGSIIGLVIGTSIGGNNDSGCQLPTT